jgi:hypothetical protein
MKRVFKYPLEITDEQSILIPKNHNIISVIEKDNVPVVYVIVEDNDPCQVERHFSIRGTGHSIPGNIEALTFLGSIKTHNDQFVWHIWIKD